MDVTSYNHEGRSCQTFCNQTFTYPGVSYPAFLKLRWLELGRAVFVNFHWGSEFRLATSDYIAMEVAKLVPWNSLLN